MVYNLTHYDLDGVCSSIMLRHFIGETKIISTGYNKIKLKFQDILNKQSKYIAITDLNFSLDMIEYMVKTNRKYLYIDHHKSVFKLDGLYNIDGIINQKFCATANILKYFKAKGKQCSENMKKLAFYANDYDMWILQTEESKIMNYIFWKNGFDYFLSNFKDGYNESIVNSFRKDYEKDQQYMKQYLENCQKDIFSYKATIKDYKCLMIYANKYISDISLVYPDFDYYFIISDSHKMSIRTKTENSLEESFKIIRQNENIETIGCHEFAGGINLKSDVSDNACIDLFLNFIQIIVGNDEDIPF